MQMQEEAELEVVHMHNVMRATLLEAVEAERISPEEAGAA